MSHSAAPSGDPLAILSSSTDCKSDQRRLRRLCLSRVCGTGCLDSHAVVCTRMHSPVASVLPRLTPRERSRKRETLAISSESSCRATNHLAWSESRCRKRDDVEAGERQSTASSRQRASQSKGARGRHARPASRMARRRLLSRQRR